MFCPKCKYTTFDHFNSCPKCGYEWEDIRKELSLDWLVEIESSEVEKIGIEEERFPQISPEGEGEKEEGIVNGILSPPKEEPPVIEEVEVSLEGPIFEEETTEGRIASSEQGNGGEEDKIEQFYEGEAIKEEINKTEKEEEDAGLVQEDIGGEISIDLLFQASGVEPKQALSSTETEAKKEKASSKEEVWDIEFTDLEIEDLTVEDSSKDVQEKNSSETSEKKKEKEPEIEVLDIVFDEDK